MERQELAPGIDVSNWQGTVDWSAVAGTGAAFAMAKATEGTDFVDPYFAGNWDGMQRVGLVRGAYHFFRPQQDAVEQAAAFTRVAPVAPTDLPPILDVEVRDGVSNAALSDGAYRWLTEVERITRQVPMIYTRAGFWNDALSDDNGRPPPWTTRYYLWVADYQSGPQPTLPNGWAAWMFWQYSGSGQVPGITARADLDRFRGPLDDLRAWARTPHVRNQTMINAFYQAFGQTGYWAVIARAGLTDMAIPASNRGLPYDGPPIDRLPNLAPPEKDQLNAALASISPAVVALGRPRLLLRVRRRLFNR